MGIVITEKDSGFVLQQKLQQAEAKAKALMQDDIMSLCGVLKANAGGNPVGIIRKMRDEEWS